MNQILSTVAHRPWPLPARPWVISFTWHDLLFAHWPAEPAAIRDVVPRPLELDLFDGHAWIGVIPFRMSGVRLRGLPALPGTASFPEVNVRTYVRAGGRAGVYFFSLDAASWLACRMARAWYRLPYHHARMTVRREDDSVLYESVRREGSQPAEFRAIYGPLSDPSAARQGSLEHWLVERYCLFTVNARGQVFSGDIHHVPWSLQDAAARIETHTLASAAGICLPDTAPILHFARRLDVVVWPSRRVTTSP